MKTETILDESENDRRLENVETKLMELENTVSQLNAVIIRQYEEIDRLQLSQERLATRLSEMNSNSDGDPSKEPPPPHY